MNNYEKQKPEEFIKDLSALERAEKEQEAFNYKGADRVITSGELKEELDATDDTMFMLKTGIPSFDRIGHGGVECGELVVITGYTGKGKTTFMMTLTHNFAEQGIKSLWFTFEVTPRQFIKKMTKRSAIVPDFYLPHEIKNNTLHWIEKKIFEAKAKFNDPEKGIKVAAVFIDHLGAIDSQLKYQGNNSLAIGNIADVIKSFAVRYNVAIFLVAHCVDPDKINPREPTEFSIRDSGLISRASDFNMGIWRIRNDADPEDDKVRTLENTDNQNKVRIWKNRREGDVGTFFMEHKDHYLTEIDKSATLNKFVAELKKEKLF